MTSAIPAYAELAGSLDCETHNHCGAELNDREYAGYALYAPSGRFLFLSARSDATLGTADAFNLDFVAVIARHIHPALEREIPYVLCGVTRRLPRLPTLNR